MVRLKSKPERALKQEPLKANNNQPTILINQNANYRQYLPLVSQGTQSGHKPVFSSKSVSDEIDERYIHPLASHPEIPKLTDLQVLITMAILEHGEPCPFDAIYQFISKKWKGFKIRRRDGTPYISDCRRAILANLRSTPSHISLFRKVGDAGYRLVRDLEEALAPTRDRRVKEAKSETESSKEHSKGTSETTQFYLTRSQTKTKKRYHYYEMENGYSEDDDETNESDSHEAQTEDTEDSGLRPRKRSHNNHSNQTPNNNNNDNDYHHSNNHQNHSNFQFQLQSSSSTVLSLGESSKFLNLVSQSQDGTQLNYVPNSLVSETLNASMTNTLNAADTPNVDSGTPYAINNHSFYNNVSANGNNIHNNIDGQSLSVLNYKSLTKRAEDLAVPMDPINGTTAPFSPGNISLESNASVSSTQTVGSSFETNKNGTIELTTKQSEGEQKDNPLALTELQRVISMAIVLSNSTDFVPLSQIQEYVGKFWGEMRGANGQPRHTDHKRAVSACLTRIYHGKYLFTRNPKDLYSWKLSKDHPWILNPSLNPLNTSEQSFHNSPNNPTNNDNANSHKFETNKNQIPNERQSNSGDSLSTLTYEKFQVGTSSVIEGGSQKSNDEISSVPEATKISMSTNGLLVADSKSLGISEAPPQTKETCQFSASNESNDEHRNVATLHSLTNGYTTQK
jgi:hypothetical protein